MKETFSKNARENGQIALLSISNGLSCCVGKRSLDYNLANNYQFGRG